VSALSDQGSSAGDGLLGDTYLLGRQINRGGMGDVFEARHARLPGRFAVKILRAELLSNREAFARFCREAEVMSELRHPNVVQIYDFNTTTDGRPYFVMELLEGRDLERRLGEEGPLPLPAAVRVVEAVASALAIAHAHGIVHRDLKPANVFLVTIDGQVDELVKVLDFGISKIRSSGTLLSSPTDMLGSPAYMSPEQARGASEVDGRSDQFALGAITYRMLTGWDPFTGDDIASLLYQVVHEEAPPLARYLPAFWDTRALQAVLDRALAKNPAQRFGGMMELARAFEAASEQTLSHESAAPGAVDLGRTLIATPPPPALRPAHLEPERPASDEVSDEPPPVRTPAPEPLPTEPLRAQEPRPEPLRPKPKRPPADLNVDFAPEAPVGRRPSGHWTEIDARDELPVTHHRLALAGLAVLLVAAILALTGLYRRIVPGIRHELGLRRATPAAPAPPAPTAEVPPVAAPSLPAPAPAKAVAPAPAKVAPPVPSKPKADARQSKDQATTKPHHHHLSEPRPIHHPGSIYLSPTKPFEPEPPAAPPKQGARANPFAQPPGAPPPSAGPDKVQDQFTIPPPAPTTDSPGRDLAPPSEPERAPSPAPAVKPPPPTAPSTPRTGDPADQPMAPSF
jgi:eukaryotic-like serine/threonine-protein kinase